MTPSPIARYSSRRAPLAGFLPEMLTGAQAYDRIAGYFSSSVLEVAGEALEGMAEGATVRVMCNSTLDPLDVATARAAKAAMFREWARSLPPDFPPPFRARLARLAGFLTSGRLQVKVLPDETFGLIHGKAGVVTRADGSRVAFMGSANESRRAWTRNYEIVWADESADGIAWVTEEFAALWHHPHAVDLAEAVIEDVVRVVKRVVIPDVSQWKERQAEAAAAAVELPVYRRESGLWAHQKTFIQRAFDLHKRGGARLVLADQVGLGKTVQLALAAKLMTLWGGGRVLVLVPKPLLRQWQGELWNLLQLPSAIWTGKGWLDEHDVTHPTAGGVAGLRTCPRRVGIVSTGLLKRPDSGVLDVLERMEFECVILDEAHHARRKNLSATDRDKPPQPNFLLQAITTLAGRTKSLLLATATPVQLNPIEAYDLLAALNAANGTVLGSKFSRWVNQPRDGLGFIMAPGTSPTNEREVWDWMRDPLPLPLPGNTDERDFDTIRRAIPLSPERAYALPEHFDRLSPPTQARVRRTERDLFAQHNPYIRHIIRRTRHYLEITLDPQTNEPYLKPVTVELFGERKNDAIPLAGYLGDAYRTAEKFCEEVGKRGVNSGFLRTSLLRRIGSSVAAGRATAKKMLASGDPDDEAGDDDDEPTMPFTLTAHGKGKASLYPLEPGEVELLHQFVAQLDAGGGEDPKYRAVETILTRGAERSDGSTTELWREHGCILFSQYHDTARWVAERLSRSPLLGGAEVALYAGGNQSGVFRGGEFTRLSRETIKEGVAAGAIRLLVGTDAASEGLNLQKIGTLVNLDLPWNPTRLEQRKGRIQRIGQVRDTVYVYNMRYRGSVEDRVHDLLSSRLAAVHDLFGQLPDVLEDVWVQVAENRAEQAKLLIDTVPKEHPFKLRNDRPETVDWETCSTVLDNESQLDLLYGGWQ